MLLRVWVSHDHEEFFLLPDNVWPLVQILFTEYRQIKEKLGNTAWSGREYALYYANLCSKQHEILAALKDYRLVPEYTEAF